MPYQYNNAFSGQKTRFQTLGTHCPQTHPPDERTNSQTLVDSNQDIPYNASNLELILFCLLIDFEIRSGVAEWLQQA